MVKAACLLAVEGGGIVRLRGVLAALAPAVIGAVIKLIVAAAGRLGRILFLVPLPPALPDTTGHCKSSQPHRIDKKSGDKIRSCRGSIAMAFACSGAKP